MTLTNKILLIILGLVAVCAVGFIIYQQHEMSVMQSQINSSLVTQKTLLDGITRSSAQYATKQDLGDFAKQNGINLAAIQKDVDSLSATVSGMNQVVVNSNGEHQSNIPSTNVTPNPNPTTPAVECNGQTIPCPNADPFGYQKNQQNLQLNEQFAQTQVPIGTVGFSSWQKNPWSVNIAPRSYDVVNVLATDQNGRQYVYNQFAITTGGKSYKLPINSAKFIQQYPVPSFSFWNPRIYIGADVGVGLTHAPIAGEFTPNLSIGFMSYGKSKINPDWSFLQVGVGYGAVSQKAQLEISPAQYNIGKHVPFMQNTFVGPTLGVGADGNVSVGLGVRVGM